MRKLFELLMKKIGDRLNMLLYTERKFDNLYSYKNKAGEIKRALLYFPDSKYMHLGDHLFFEPLAKNLKKLQIEVKVYPTKGMERYFKALGYSLADENWQKEEYDLIVSRPVFFPELKGKTNVFFYDYITSGLREKICSDILEKVFKAAGLELDSAAERIPTIWNGEEFCEERWENNISGRDKYILFNNYLDSGKAFNFGDKNMLFEDKIMELKEMGYKIIQLGTAKEREMDRREYPSVDIDLRGKTSVEELFRLCSLENVHGNVGFDGFLMHLCFLNGKRNYIAMRNKVTKRREEQTKKFLNPPFEIADEKIEYLERKKDESCNRLQNVRLFRDRGIS